MNLLKLRKGRFNLLGVDSRNLEVLISFVTVPVSFRVARSTSLRSRLFSAIPI